MIRSAIIVAALLISGAAQAGDKKQVLIIDRDSSLITDARTGQVVATKDNSGGSTIIRDIRTQKTLAVVPNGRRKP